MTSGLSPNLVSNIASINKIFYNKTLRMYYEKNRNTYLFRN